MSTLNEKIRAKAQEILARPPVRFNDNYEVPPWTGSIVDEILQRLTPRTSARLLEDAVVRALEIRVSKGTHALQSGEDGWSEILRWALNERHPMAAKISQPDLLTTEEKRECWNALVDVCAVTILGPGGRRIGDRWICLYVSPLRQHLMEQQRAATKAA
jgi:hypothetical protein